MWKVCLLCFECETSHWRRALDLRIINGISADLIKIELWVSLKGSTIGWKLPILTFYSGAVTAVVKTKWIWKMRNAKAKKIFIGEIWAGAGAGRGQGEGLERRGELVWPGLTGDLKVITAGMSQVRPHFDEWLPGCLLASLPACLSAF